MTTSDLVRLGLPPGARGEHPQPLLVRTEQPRDASRVVVGIEHGRILTWTFGPTTAF
ncbi:hypothetical protein [Acrocarpospora macrocephala]|uniref:hypothetical protein n=1 Tax=Acrocarpospora macrocephala TaxID=150177 RepID=UPI001C3FEBCE|nr:hypothetical protein [Acrocarpospora macrocephala]